MKVLSMKTGLMLVICGLVIMSLVGLSQSVQAQINGNIYLPLIVCNSCSAATATSTPVATATPIITASFTLTSSAVVNGGELPADYTCDGTSSTVPLTWQGAPANTQSFALTMYHIPGPGDTHWYWVLYNIPVTVTNLPKNVTGIGILGNNSVNGRTEYAPPCSKGPGAKVYSYTLYALSAPPVFTVAAAEVSRDVLLAAISDRTLASTELGVTYTRPSTLSVIWNWLGW